MLSRGSMLQIARQLIAVLCLCGQWTSLHYSINRSSPVDTNRICETSGRKADCLRRRDLCDVYYSYDDFISRHRLLFHFAWHCDRLYPSRPAFRKMCRGRSDRLPNFPASQGLLKPRALTRIRNYDLSFYFFRILICVSIIFEEIFLLNDWLDLVTGMTSPRGLAAARGSWSTPSGGIVVVSYFQ